MKKVEYRVTTVREKYLDNEIFSRSGNFVDGQGNLERTWKVREKSREFEIKWLWQAVFRKFIYSVQEVKGCTSHEIV